jgi:hypothetical protein
MKGITSFKSKYAVSEVVGSMLLVLIAVICFSVVQAYLFPSEPDIPISVKIEGTVSEAGIVVLEHIGGNTLDSYKVMVWHSNGSFIGSKICENDDWTIGESRYPLENITDIRLVNDSVQLKITIYSIDANEGEEQVFTWSPSGKMSSVMGGCPILISSLRTNTVDEDLICYSYPVDPDVNATTYIYNWRVNGVTLTDLNMPFNTEDNSTSKDYSGYGIDGTLVGSSWSSEGIL